MVLRTRLARPGAQLRRKAVDVSAQKVVLGYRNRKIPQEELGG